MGLGKAENSNRVQINHACLAAEQIREKRLEHFFHFQILLQKDNMFEAIQLEIYAHNTEFKLCF